MRHKPEKRQSAGQATVQVGFLEMSPLSPWTHVPDPSKSSSSQRFPETEVADGLGGLEHSSVADQEILGNRGL